MRMRDSGRKRRGKLWRRAGQWHGGSDSHIIISWAYPQISLEPQETGGKRPSVQGCWWHKAVAEIEDVWQVTSDILSVRDWAPLHRPGHGAPTGDIRKKKFTEHQLGRALRRSQSVFSLEDKEKFIRRPYSDDMNIDPRVRETWVSSFKITLGKVLIIWPFQSCGHGSLVFIVMALIIVTLST